MVKRRFYFSLMKRTPLILIVFLFAALPVFAQDLSQSISGSIKEYLSQQAIAQANVSLYRESELIKGAVSDSLGYFFIKDVEPGRYKLIASFTGYAPFDACPVRYLQPRDRAEPPEALGHHPEHDPLHDPRVIASRFTPRHPAAPIASQR